MIVHSGIEGTQLAGNLLGDLTERDLFVYLPPGYEESDTRYPTAYLLHALGSSAELEVSPKTDGQRWHPPVEDVLDPVFGRLGTAPPRRRPGALDGRFAGPAFMPGRASRPSCRRKRRLLQQRLLLHAVTESATTSQPCLCCRPRAVRRVPDDRGRREQGPGSSRQVRRQRPAKRA